MLMSLSTTGYTNTDAKLVCRRACASNGEMRTRRCTPALRLEVAVRVHALDLEHRALDPRFFALAQVEDLDGVALSLGPARVHAHEHLRPVLRFGAAGAGADLELRVAEIVRMREQRAETELLELLAERARPRDRPRPPSPRPAPRRASPSARARSGCARSMRLEGIDPVLERLDLLHDAAAPTPGCSRSPALPIRSSSCGQLLPLVIEVKDTSSARRADRRTRTAACARSLSAMFVSRV